MTLKTSCRFCASRCGMLAHFEGKKLTHVEGDPGHPVSRGWCCARGRGATAGQFAKAVGPVVPHL
ncbi:MAG: hypothetical protein R6U89_07390 [Dehalococcoidia bacterium]